MKSTVLRYLIPLVLLAPPLLSQIERITIEERVYLAQRVKGNSVKLTPNACYFDGKGLRCTGKGPATYPGKELNRGKSFARIKGLTAVNQVSWFLYVHRAGTATISLDGASGLDEQERVWIELGILGKEESKRMTLSEKPRRLVFAAAGIYRIRTGTTTTTPIAFTGPTANAPVISSERCATGVLCSTRTGSASRSIV